MIASEHCKTSIAIPVFLFTGATFASFLYCFATGQFNGDFYPREITMSDSALLGCLAVALAPYALSLWMQRRIAQHPQRTVITVSPKFLHCLLLITMGWHMAMTHVFAVGVMNQDFYDAPAWIKPFIQISNRIDPFYVAVFYILATPKRLASDLGTAMLMISLGLMRAGLGAFVYILIALTIKYKVEILGWIRRRYLLIGIVALAIPYAIATLYDLRAELRGEEAAALAVADLLLAKLAGRLSSYSNLAYLIQEFKDFSNTAQALSPFYYIQQILGSAVSGSLAPPLTPEIILIDVNLLYDGFSTYMAGVPGNLLLAWAVSPFVAMMNLSIMLAMIAAILKLSNQFGNGTARLLGASMLLYPLTSGVAHEFSSLLVNVIVLQLLCRAAGRVARTNAVPSTAPFTLDSR